jgi:sugar lactone lactonase YvrE
MISMKPTSTVHRQQFVPAQLNRLTQWTRILSSTLLTAAVVACSGNGGDLQVGAVAAPGSNVVAAELTLVAGSIGSAGNLDGKGESARLEYLRNGIADATGNLFVIDGFKVRKVTPDGTVTTLAGSGKQGRADGKGDGASFVGPTHIAMDGAGNLYVTDAAVVLAGGGSSDLVSYASVRRITPEGIVTTLAGETGANFGQQVDGKGSAAKFAVFRGIAADATGNVFVFDANMLRKVSGDGVVSTITTLEDDDRTGNPSANNLVVDRAGNLYAGTAMRVMKVTQAAVKTTFMVPLDTRTSSGMSGLAMDVAGSLLTVHGRRPGEPGKILRIDPASGVATPVAAFTQALVIAPSAGLAASSSDGVAIAADNQGGLYLLDQDRFTLRKVNAGGVITNLAGLEGKYGSSDGTGSAASFNVFYFGGGAAVDQAGNIYFTDALGKSVRKITPAGVVTSVAKGAFNAPTAIAVDRASNIYVTDITESGTVVQPHSSVVKISTSGLLSTYAGAPGVNGLTPVGYVDGPSASARFANPRGVAADSTANVYVADSGNSVIRKITPDGVVTTLAGAAGQPGHVDGAGAAARFGDLASLTVDGAGNLYVVDMGIGGTSRGTTIRKVTPGGVVSTLAGRSDKSGVTDGTGTEALLGYPQGITIDPVGNLYTADGGTIRRISLEGRVTTIAGRPEWKGIRLGTEAISFGFPTGLAFVAPNALLVHDGGAVLKLTLR